MLKEICPSTQNTAKHKAGFVAVISINTFLLHLTANKLSFTFKKQE